MTIHREAVIMKMHSVLKEAEGMKEHERKIVTTIIITIIFVLYYILYFMVLLAELPGTVSKLLFGLIPVFLMGVMIFVCIQRINEIRSGEEDDLSEY